jgi:CRISPR-associated protein Cst1
MTLAVVTAAAAPAGTAPYDWWKVLFALYPNSPATHSKRSRDTGELRTVIGRLFAPDEGGGGAAPCSFCGQPASVVWGKDKLPMFDSLKAVNTLPPRLPGWPVCRGCRMAMWALPYGAWVTAGSATVLSCADDEVEHSFAVDNVERARQIQQLGFTGLPPHASAETMTLAALREHAGGSPAGTTLWVFKNDNQEAWLRVTSTRGGIPAFLRVMLAEPDCRAGWRALEGALTERDKDGVIKASGAGAAARTLFDPADRPGAPGGDRLQRELLRLSKDIDKRSARTLTSWRELSRLYLEVIHQMDVEQLKPARELLTDWITHGTNPRGRYNEYVASYGKAFELHAVMVRAANRLLLDGSEPADVSALAPALFGSGPNGWRLRGQLYFEIVANLVERGVPIGHKAAPDEPEEAAEPGTGLAPATDRE